MCRVSDDVVKRRCSSFCRPTLSYVSTGWQKAASTNRGPAVKHRRYELLYTCIEDAVCRGADKKDTRSTGAVKSKLSE